jgi:hypothetical protein
MNNKDRCAKLLDELIRRGVPRELLEEAIKWVVKR